jgi:hypothetical protein
MSVLDQPDQWNAIDPKSMKSLVERRVRLVKYDQ